MKVLLTGATRFVGKPFCDALVDRGYEVIAATRQNVSVNKYIEIANVGQIDEQTRWNEVLRDVDVVIHLTARVHVMQDDTKNSLDEFRKINVKGTANLARQAAQA